MLTKRFIVTVSLIVGAILLTSNADAAPQSSFVQGGNTFGASAVLGTNDSFPLSIRANSESRIVINPVGAVGSGYTRINGADTPQQAGGVIVLNGGDNGGSVGIAGGTNTGSSGGGDIVLNGGPALDPEKYGLVKVSGYHPTMLVGSISIGQPSTVPGCIILGDSDGVGVTYVTANDGVLSSSATRPATCLDPTD
jgi:hypothetical protein